MTHKLFIFCSILCITPLTYSMEKTLTKIKKKKQKTSQNISTNNRLIANNLLLKYFLFSPALLFKQHNLPQDIIKLIQIRCLQLEDKTFETTFPYVEQWDDYSIPRYMYSFLTEPQKEALGVYLESISSYIPQNDGTAAIHYHLTQPQYETFKTIPIEVRQYLTKLPESQQEILKKRKQRNPENRINNHGIVRIETLNKYGGVKSIKGKYIIPEGKPKNIKLNVNQ